MTAPVGAQRSGRNGPWAAFDAGAGRVGYTPVCEICTRCRSLWK